MIRKDVIRVALVALVLVLATPLFYPAPSYTGVDERHVMTVSTMFLFAFGLLNALVDVPGLLWLRIVSIGAMFWGFRNPPLALPLLIAACFFWPPAFFSGWALAADKQSGRITFVRSQSLTAGIIVAVALASVLYRLLLPGGYAHTSALFIGIPTVLAIAATLAPTPRSAAGVAVKAVTIGLLVSLILLDEGFLCVLMSAPLFYGVALVLVGVAQAGKAVGRSSISSALIVVIAVPASLEGVIPSTTINGRESVAVTKIVHAHVEAISRALVAAPRYDRVPSALLRAGFPRPVSATIDLAATPPRWLIDVRGGEMRFNGVEPVTGTLTLELVESTPGHLRWHVLSDTSHMTHFLFWRDITVDWTRVADDATQVTWTLAYERGLDPAWYFGPMERYVSRLAAGYLIDAVATP